jgi:hypothetical protein
MYRFLQGDFQSKQKRNLVFLVIDRGGFSFMFSPLGLHANTDALLATLSE